MSKTKEKEIVNYRQKARETSNLRRESYELTYYQCHLCIIKLWLI